MHRAGRIAAAPIRRAIRIRVADPPAAIRIRRRLIGNHARAHRDERHQTEPEPRHAPLTYLLGAGFNATISLKAPAGRTARFRAHCTAVQDPYSFELPTVTRP